MGPHALVGSFGYGPEAVFSTFFLIFGLPVIALWGIGQIKHCGFAERWAFGLLRLYWRILSWPFRWLGRQIEAAANQAANALGRLLVRSLQVTGWIVSWPVRALGWFVWEQTRMAFQNRARFRPRPLPDVIPPRRRPRGRGRRP
ncbi:TPA: hypothetical protein DEA21_01200 [Candidatus Uhrbacteria bacterium]|nr:hypothetical protein [Candidatus Uhrbacteria bacterium]